ncbi:site-specific DNA-methyltransferase [Campylobacter sp. 50012-21]|uniref:site-specific DNA-methyltransferase n=1 Tax=Campylobacter magnus TaxID=3026462 RepID=UPI002362A8D9|nr:site-specific DNA-methyltransferase [Campylobacter magnus]MDD0845610.1 site-specific DNA-methyltransferase [Campylobacter magnus]
MNKEEILISDIKEKFDTLGVARSLAISDDDRILDFLLKDSKYSQEYKERFFKEHSLALVFKKDDFLNFLDLKLLNSSYTSFSNKIGLGTKAKRFIKNDENVVLNFPFKDGVLKGGQSKDDEKSNEIFFNNVLAKSDIDALFSPKVLTNFELLGEGDIKEVLKNNPSLLIKGNNLIALHTLKEYFRHQSEQNKVKLIYIDPPYNTGNDDFNYNDKFKHSTWLCFMKNRLEIARELLRDDGVIFVQCDDNEQAYLKVLMDEIFGRENFVCNLIPLMNPRGRQESAYPIAKSHEYILCYSKKEDAATFFNFGITKNEEISDEIRLLSLRKSGNASLRKDRPNMFYPIFYNTKTNLIYTKQTNDEFEIAIYPIKTNGDEGRWRWQKSNVENNIDLLVCKKNSKDEYDIYVKDYIIKDGQTRGEKTKTFVIDKNIINDKAKEHLEQLFNNKECFSYPKSEYLLQRILEISTNENDLVLDFFAGSGTTMAVAHKMKRRCITIEQMDYIQTITKERIKKVIDGEQGGISKAVSWSGGGNVVYCELAPLNAYFVEKIQNSRNEAELESIIASMSEKAFIDYRVDIKKALEDKEFSALSLEDKKATLIDCLDRNMDYIPYADINDSEYKISDEAKKLNKIFYNKGE